MFSIPYINPTNHATGVQIGSFTPANSKTLNNKEDKPSDEQYMLIVLCCTVLVSYDGFTLYVCVAVHSQPKLAFQFCYTVVS